MKQQKQRLIDYLSNNDIELTDFEVAILSQDERLDAGSIGSPTPIVHVTHRYEVKFTLRLTEHEIRRLQRDTVICHMRLGKRMEQE